MITLLLLKEMLQSISQRRTQIPQGQTAKRKWHKGERKHHKSKQLIHMNSKHNEFDLVVDGVHMGKFTTPNYMTRQQARGHFAKKHPGKFVHVSTRK